MPGPSAPAGPARVDRAAGVIKGVKVLARKSRNGREYTPECLQKARPLYEGVSVRINHPDQPDADTDRKSEDVLGQLRNVRIGPDGLYADLEYLKSHPMAARLCEAAERMPGAYGLSHNVSDWKGGYEGGTYVVREILEVESVDLVADPATTSGLFESKRRGRRRKGMRLTEWLRRQQPPVRRVVRRLIEVEAMAPSMLVDDTGGDPEEAIKTAFRAAITAILDDVGADMKLKLSKIKEIMTAEEKLMASGAVTPTTADDTDADLDADTADLEPDMGDEETPEFMAGDDEDFDDDGIPDEDENLAEGDEEDEDSDDEDDDDVPGGKYESIRRENKQLKRELEVRRLCESQKAQPGPAVLKALMKCDNDRDRKALLRESRSRRQVPAAAEDTDFATSITRREEDDE